MAEKSRGQRLPRRAESRIVEADSTKGRLPDGGASLRLSKKSSIAGLFRIYMVK